MTFKYKFCHYAVELNDFEECKRMVEAGIPLHLMSVSDPSQAIYYSFIVAENGNLPFLKWLIEEQNIGWCIDTPTAAASTGQNHIIKYCIENGCEYNLEKMAQIALYNRKFECVKFLFLTYGVDFWKCKTNLVNDDMVNKIDLDDKDWRKLFEHDLSEWPFLKEKVEEKKTLLTQSKKMLTEKLNPLLPFDIIQYCIFPHI